MAVVGFVILLALVVTAYANAARTHAPESGREAEERTQVEWRESLLTGHASLLSDASADVVLRVPAPKSPAPGWVVFPQSLVPPAASAHARLVPDCAGLVVTRTLGSATVVELNRSSMMCLRVEAETTYSPPFAFQDELGALIMRSGSQAAVLEGPLVVRDINATDGSALLRLRTYELRGPADANSLDSDGLRMTATPRGTSVDVPAAPNANQVTITVSTQYPAAWRAWMTEQAQTWGATMRASASCVPADCSTPGGRGSARLVVLGPGDTAADLRFVLDHRVHDVTLG